MHYVSLVCIVEPLVKNTSILKTLVFVPLQYINQLVNKRHFWLRTLPLVPCTLSFIKRFYCTICQYLTHQTSWMRNKLTMKLLYEIRLWFLTPQLWEDSSQEYNSLETSLYRCTNEAKQCQKFPLIAKKEGF